MAVQTHLNVNRQFNEWQDSGISVDIAFDKMVEEFRQLRHQDLIYGCWAKRIVGFSRARCDAVNSEWLHENLRQIAAGSRTRCTNVSQTIEKVNVQVNSAQLQELPWRIRCRYVAAHKEAEYMEGRTVENANDLIRDFLIKRRDLCIRNILRSTEEFVGAMMGYGPKGEALLATADTAYQATRAHFESYMRATDRQINPDREEWLLPLNHPMEGPIEGLLLGGEVEQRHLDETEPEKTVQFEYIPHTTTKPKPKCARPSRVTFADPVEHSSDYHDGLTDEQVREAAIKSCQPEPDDSPPATEYTTACEDAAITEVQRSEIRNGSQSDTDVDKEKRDGGGGQPAAEPCPPAVKNTDTSTLAAQPAASHNTKSEEKTASTTIVKEAASERVASINNNQTPVSSPKSVLSSTLGGGNQDKKMKKTNVGSPRSSKGYSSSKSTTKQRSSNSSSTKSTPAPSQDPAWNDLYKSFYDEDDRKDESKMEQGEKTGASSANSVITGDELKEDGGGQPAAEPCPPAVKHTDTSTLRTQPATAIRNPKPDEKTASTTVIKPASEIVSNTSNETPVSSPKSVLSSTLGGGNQDKKMKKTNGSPRSSKDCSSSKSTAKQRSSNSSSAKSTPARSQKSAKSSTSGTSRRSSMRGSTNSANTTKKPKRVRIVVTPRRSSPPSSQDHGPSWSPPPSDRTAGQEDAAITEVQRSEIRNGSQSDTDVDKEKRDGGGGQPAAEPCPPAVKNTDTSTLAAQPAAAIHIAKSEEKTASTTIVKEAASESVASINNNKTPVSSPKSVLSSTLGGGNQDKKMKKKKNGSPRSSKDCSSSKSTAKQRSSNSSSAKSTPARSQDPAWNDLYKSFYDEDDRKDESKMEQGEKTGASSANSVITGDELKEDGGGQPAAEPCPPAVKHTDTSTLRTQPATAIRNPKPDEKTASTTVIKPASEIVSNISNETPTSSPKSVLSSTLGGGNQGKQMKKKKNGSPRSSKDCSSSKSTAKQRSSNSSSAKSTPARSQDPAWNDLYKSFYDEDDRKDESKMEQGEKTGASSANSVITGDELKEDGGGQPAAEPCPPAVKHTDTSTLRTQPATAIRNPKPDEKTASTTVIKPASEIVSNISNETPTSSPKSVLSSTLGGGNQGKQMKKKKNGSPRSSKDCSSSKSTAKQRSSNSSSAKSTPARSQKSAKSSTSGTSRRSSMRGSSSTSTKKTPKRSSDERAKPNNKNELGTPSISSATSTCKEASYAEPPGDDKDTEGQDQVAVPRAPVGGRPKEYGEGRCVACKPGAKAKPVSLRYSVPACVDHNKRFGQLAAMVEEDDRCPAYCTDRKPCYACRYDNFVELGFKMPEDE